jgi:hypothetical protein
VIVLTSFNPAALRYSLADTLTLAWPEVLDVARTALEVLASAAGL